MQILWQQVPKNQSFRSVLAVTNVLNPIPPRGEFWGGWAAGDGMSVLHHGGSDLRSIFSCFCLHIEDWFCTQHRLQKHLLLCKMFVAQLKIWVNPNVGFSKNEKRGEAGNYSAGWCSEELTVGTRKLSTTGGSLGLVQSWELSAGALIDSISC